MSKSFSFPNVGTCSKQTNIVLNDDHTIESVEVIGGCNGNLRMPSPAWRVPPAAPAPPAAPTRSPRT